MNIKQETMNEIIQEWDAFMTIPMDSGQATMFEIAIRNTLKQVRKSIDSFLVNPFPGPDIINFEISCWIIRIRKPPPFRHGFTIKIHGQRLIPVCILSGPYHLTINIPFDNFLIPFQATGNKFVSQSIW